MLSFELETQFPISADELAQSTLNMSGVNYELAPLLKMTAPKTWQSTNITDWPTNKNLFGSNILLLGIIPIDRHYFKFETIDRSGFKEISKSIINAQWCHERLIKNIGSGSVIKDVITYQSKLVFLGAFLKPIYKAIFKHRHNRLRTKYIRRMIIK